MSTIFSCHAEWYVVDSVDLEVNIDCLVAGLGDRVPDVARSFWMAYWGGKGIDIGSMDGLKRALANSVLNTTQIDSLLEDTQTVNVKEGLLVLTKEALDLGAFGAPWITVTLPGCKEKEVFFGSDRFHLIADLVSSILFEFIYLLMGEDSLVNLTLDHCHQTYKK